MAQQAFYTKINAGAGVQFSGGTVAQATAVLHTNNVLYLRGGSAGLFLQNSDASEGMFLSNSYISLETDSTERLRITSGGNVGIGTSSPGMKLHIKGGDEATMKLESTSGEPAIFWAPGSSSLKWEQRASASRWQLYQYDESEWVFNIYDGKVGIGEVSPSHKITVPSGTNGRVARLGNLEITTQSGTYTGSSIEVTDTNSFITYRSTLGHKFFTRTSGGGNTLEAMTIVPDTGRVGIGTSAPAALLDVTASTAPVFRLYRSGTGQVWTQEIDSSGRWQLREAASSGGTKYTRLQVDDPGNVTFSAYGSGSFTGTAAYNLQVDSSGNIIETAAGGSGTVTGSGTATYIPKFSSSTAITSSGMFQAASNNFSIGVTTPNATFSISGDLSIGTSATDVLRLHNESGVGTIDGYSTRSIAFGSATNGEVMRIDNANGRVGIGTASPSKTLHVAGPGGSTGGIMIAPTSGDAEIQFQDSGVTNAYITLDDGTGDMNFRDDSATVLTVDFSNERVGVLNASPQYALDVAGVIKGTSSIRVDAGSPYFGLYNSGTEKAYLQWSQSSSLLTLQSDGAINYTSGGLQKWTINASEKMTLNTDGELGINQSNPRAKLEIYNTAVTSDADYSATETPSGQDSIILYTGGTAENTYGSISWVSGGRRRAMITAVAENSDTDYQGIAFYTQGTDGSGDFYESMRIKHSGQISFYDYRGTNNTGTPTYLLGTDANGLMVKTNSGSDLPGGPYLPLAGGTMTGPLVIQDSVSDPAPLLTLYNSTNGGGSTVLFSDQTGSSQKGRMTFFHSDGSSQGGGATFQFYSTEADMTLQVGASGSTARVVVWSANNQSEVGYGFGDDVNTGMTRLGADQVGLIAGAVQGVYVSTTAVQLKNAGNTKLATTTTGVTITGNADVSSNVLVGGADSYFGENVLRFKSAGAAYIDHNTTGQSIIFRTSDSSSLDTTALTISSAGYATFGSGISATNTSFSGTMNIAGGIYHIGDTDTFFGFVGGANTWTLSTGGSTRLDVNDAGVRFGGSGARIVIVKDEDDMAANSNVALATQQSIKAYVDNSISGATVYKGTWDPSSGTYGSPDLSTASLQVNGQYYICSANGSATPNGAGTEPDSWHVGDWVIWNDDLGGSGEWQKIDNTSVISGAGTGQKVVKWDGSGTSETIADGPITFSSNDSTFAGDIFVAENVGHAGDTDTKVQFGTNDLKLKAGGATHFHAASNQVTLLYSGNSTALTLNTSQDALFASDVAITGKLAVGATSAHASYDLYNQGTFYSNGAATINANLTVDAGSISITSDGSNAATLTESGSGDFTIAAIDDIRLDSGGNDIVLRGASSSEFGRLSNSSQTFIIKNINEDKDIRFDGNDGNGTSGTNITAFRLDMSDAGWAHFNSGIAVGNLSATSTFSGALQWGNGKGLLTYGSDRAIMRSASSQALELQTNGGTTLMVGVDANATFSGDVTVNGGDIYLALSGSTQRAVSSTGTNSMQIGDAGTQKLRFKNAVGIALDIEANGNATFAGDVLLSTTKGLYTNVVQAVSSAGLKLGNDNNSGYIFIKDSGEVNIGTESPSSNSNYGTGDLNVENDTFASAQIMSHNSTAGNFSFLGIGKSSGTGASPTIVQADETVGLIGFYGYDGAAYRRTADIRSKIDGTPGNADMPGNLEFWTTADGASSSTKRLTIGQSGNATFTGNVYLTGTKKLYLTDDGTSNYIVESSDNVLDFVSAGVVGLQLSGTSASMRSVNFNGNITTETDSTFNIGSTSKRFANIWVDNINGGTPTTGGPYLPLSGGTMTGNVIFNDNVSALFGTSSDMTIKHDGSNSKIENNTGHLYFIQEANDKNIYFQGDNGIGGATTYFRVDGAGENVQYAKNLLLYDNVNLLIGSGGDLQMYHNGSTSYIRNNTGTLEIRNQTSGASDVYFKTTTSDPSLDTFIILDGSAEQTQFTKNTEHQDGVKALFGTDSDMEVFHNGSQAYIENYTGEMNFTQHVNNGYMRFKCDDGSGGTATYMLLDGSNERVTFNKDGRWIDGKKAQFGTTSDLEIYHDGSNSYIDEIGTGSLHIRSAGAIRLQSDTGENMIYCVNDGAVNLYHNNVNMFATASDGVIVKGDSNDITFVNNSATDHNYLKVFVPDTTVNALGVSQTNIYIPIALEVDGVVTLNNNLQLQDSDSLQLGNSQDLEIYHASGNSNIDNKVGHLYIRNNVVSDNGSNIYIQAKSGENSIICNDDGSVNLYYNNSAKFYTHTSGVGAAGYYGFGSAGTSTGSSYYYRYGSVAAGATQGMIITTSDTGGSYFDGVAQFRNTNTGQGAGMFQMINFGALYGRYINFYRGSTSNIIGYIGYNATNTAVTYSTSSSDIRLKKNIVTWDEEVLPKFLALTPKKFDFKAAVGDKGADKVKGFIAQYEAENFPEVYQLNGNGQDARYGFHPMEMVPYLMKAVKELAEKNKDLERRLAALEK